MRIRILIGGHLSTAPRAQKEALALRDAGHDIEINGVWCEPEKIEQDRALIARTALHFRPALDFSGGSAWREILRARVRLQARWARESFSRRGTFSPELLGYGARHLLALALTSPADLTLVHSEAGLWVARQLLQQGHRVGIDFEDWFSRDLPAHARRHRPVRELEELERFVASRAHYVIAPSQAMSRALAQAFDIPLPEVIYNAFPWQERLAMDGVLQDRVDRDLPSLHWVSQHIGPDRGLELLFQALPLVRHWTRLYLRGSCSPATRQWLARVIPPALKSRITLLPPVPASELLSRTAEHDIGLALESADIPSRDLSVSNKLFHYLQAGLAVIATDTQGQREILQQGEGAGVILEQATPQHLAEKIDHYLASPAALARAQRAALASAEKLFSWEIQRPRLVARALSALPPPAAHAFVPSTTVYPLPHARSVGSAGPS